MKVSDVGFNDHMGEVVDNCVQAARDANPKLALGKEVSGRVGRRMF